MQPMNSPADAHGANRRALREMGFAVWRLWDHDLEGGRIVRTQLALERRL